MNQGIKFEVFIHKVDGLSDDRKIEAQRDIHQRATDELADVGLEGIHLSFYLTSIYDHTIFEVTTWGGLGKMGRRQGQGGLGEGIKGGWRGGARGSCVFMFFFSLVGAGLQQSGAKADPTASYS